MYTCPSTEDKMTKRTLVYFSRYVHFLSRKCNFIIKFIRPNPTSDLFLTLDICKFFCVNNAMQY